MMANACRSDMHLAFPRLNGTVFHFKAQRFIRDRGQCVFLVVAVPGTKAVGSCCVGFTRWKPDIGRSVRGLTRPGGSRPVGKARQEGGTLSDPVPRHP